MHNPALYGKPHNQIIYYGDIPASGDASGFAQNMTGDTTGLNWKAGNQGIGQYTLRQEQAMMQQSSGSHVHLWAAGMVTGAIVLLFIFGLMFPGFVQF